MQTNKAHASLRQRDARRTASGRLGLSGGQLLHSIATCVFLVSIAVMLFEGVSRAAFDRSWFWAEESVRYLMVWAFFLTLGVTGRAGHHIRTELLVDHLGPRLRKTCHLLASLVGVAFCGLLFYASLPQVQRYYTMGMMTESNLDLPVWLLFLIMPLGALLYLTYYLGCTVRAWRGEDPFSNPEKAEGSPL
ncbi:TRAP transporter small permease [Stutzerimonas stutzeri]|uniref:TRAP transporter small permease n=1 Tax=Stutzerimonas stutzeri TaxID=316 RepID=UPI00210AFFD9|nr:TRAP transporter small permease [Stutzerimonas stutzeri]MCQ4321740.1 TRAP transporter small permease [Stutzerimonas stutzeri]